jgi:dTDP-4-dehydrorhamnose reductase
MEQKILLLGSSGLLGSAFKVIASSYMYEVIDWYRKDIDKLVIPPSKPAFRSLVDQDKLIKEIEKIKPDYVVNCIAYTNVDKAEINNQQNFFANYDIPMAVSIACGYLGIPNIYYSTDMVFIHNNNRHINKPYREDEVTTNIYSIPTITAYASSKWSAEQFTREYPKHYIIRTAGLYGGYYNNKTHLINKIVSKFVNGIRCKYLEDRVISTTYNVDLVKATLKLLESNARFGTYHITNGGSCTVYEFASFVIKSLVKILRTSFQYSESFDINDYIEPCRTIDFKETVHRARYSVLDNSKFEIETNTRRPRDWEEAVVDYLNRIAFSVASGLKTKGKQLADPVSTLINSIEFEVADR